MTAGELVAVVGATLVAVLAGALAVALAATVRTLRELRATLDALRTDVLALLDDADRAVHDAVVEVDRVERLVTSAERLESTVDTAGRLARRTFSSPVVKAMAFGTGVSRAAQRLRDGESPSPAAARRGRARRRRGA
jgi:hypothetical protein